MLENGCMVNFHAEKFSFIGSTPHHVNINSARVFVRLIFIAAINYDNIFATNTSRFMVAENFHRRKFHHTQLHANLQVMMITLVDSGPYSRIRESLLC